MPLLAGALAEPCMKGTNPEAFLSSLLALATIVLIASEDRLGSVRPPDSDLASSSTAICRQSMAGAHLGLCDTMSQESMPLPEQSSAVQDCSGGVITMTYRRHVNHAD